MITRNRTNTVLTLAAVAIAALAFTTTSAHAAPIAGDGVASFDLGSAAVSGDYTNNPNGLSITGQSGAWALLTTGTGTATDNGVTLTFTVGGSAPTGDNWGATTGDNRVTGAVNGNNAIRLGTFLADEMDIDWTITGLMPNALYDMIWYNKRVSPGENRAPNTGVTGFDAGNGIGASTPHDGDNDQNFLSVSADGTGAISGTWFLTDGLEDITAVTGVQIVDAPVVGSATPEPSTAILAALGVLGLLGFRRRRHR